MGSKIEMDRDDHNNCTDSYIFVYRLRLNDKLLSTNEISIPLHVTVKTFIK